MNVSLTPELEKFIEKKVKSGMYQTSSEVVREALRMLRDHETRVAELRKEIQVGIDEYERGEAVPMTKALFDGIGIRGRKRLTESKNRGK